MTDSLKDTMKDLNKEFGAGSIVEMDDKQIKIESIPTGCLALDEVFACGGMPRGRIIEIFGQESSGKSTLALFLVAEVQRQGGQAVWIDAEYAFSREHAENIGVDVDKLIMSQPSSGEEALKTVAKTVETGEVDIIVIDSVPALIPRKELEGEIGDAEMAQLARMMSKGMRMIMASIARNKTVVIFINQTREKIGVYFGNKISTPGGKALKFYSSVRIEVKKGKRIESKDGEVIGNWMNVCAVKNKVGLPFRKTEFELLFREGIDVVGAIFDLAVKEGIITKEGNTHSYADLKLGVGREVAKEKLKESGEALEAITAQLKEKVNG